MIKKLKHKLLLSVGLGALVFLGLSIYSDSERLAEAFGRFDARYIPVALALALVNYLVRFVRWHLYLKLLGIPLAWRDRVVIFLAGLVLSVTPGKAGELLKAYFIQYRLGTPISWSAPAVIAERLTDFISLICLTFLGILTFESGAFYLVLGGVGIGLFLLVLGRASVVAAFLRTVGRLPVVARLAAPLGRAYEGIRLLVAPANLLWAVVLGAGAWFAECLGFHFVLLGFDVDVGVVQATFIYGFATLFGAVTMLPGGLGPTEGSMSGLLVLKGISLPNAVAATFVIRVCTLWFAVALGAGVLLVYRSRFEAESEGDAEPVGGRGVQKREGIAE